MEEGYSEQPTLQDVLAELRQQRADVQALKDEFRGASDSVVSEVRKLKTTKDIKWKFQGNQIQYEFNSSLDDVVGQLVWSIEHKKFDYSLDLCKDISLRIKKRNKLIRIADSSSGGWETVRQYESNPVASDSEDEAKISKAENRALKRKKGSNKPKLSSSTSTAAAGSQQWGQGAFPSYQQPSGRGRFFRPVGNSYQSVCSGGYNAPAPGPCYACGEFGHFRKNCPYLNRSTAPSGTQTQGGK